MKKDCITTENKAYETNHKWIKKYDKLNLEWNNTN